VIIASCAPSLSSTGFAVWKPEFVREPGVVYADLCCALAEARTVSAATVSGALLRARVIAEGLARELVRLQRRGVQLDVVYLEDVEDKVAIGVCAAVFAAHGADLVEVTAPVVAPAVRRMLVNDSCNHAGRQRPRSDAEVAAVWLGLEVMSAIKVGGDLLKAGSDVASPR
jgi:hypothetical protein